MLIHDILRACDIDDRARRLVYVFRVFEEMRCDLNEKDEVGRTPLTLILEKEFDANLAMTLAFEFGMVGDLSKAVAEDNRRYLQEVVPQSSTKPAGMQGL